MKVLENAVKKSLPLLVGSLKDWLSVKVEIRLFGVKIFTFVWPPESDAKSDVVESDAKSDVVESDSSDSDSIV